MKTATHKVRVSTTEYEFVHGKKPRGTGHWFFYIKEGAVEASIWMTGTYSEATHGAKKFAKNIGATEIKVGA